jgi:hypothetical protein
MKTKMLSTLGALALTLFLTAGGPAGTQTAKAQGLVEYALIETLPAIEVVTEMAQLSHVERGTSYSTGSGELKIVIDCCINRSEDKDSCDLNHVCHCTPDPIVVEGGGTVFSCKQESKNVHNGHICDCPTTGIPVLISVNNYEVYSYMGPVLGARFEGTSEYLSEY